MYLSIPQTRVSVDQGSAKEPKRAGTRGRKGHRWGNVRMKGFNSPQIFGV